jgi:hypothetical protein
MSTSKYELVIEAILIMACLFFAPCMIPAFPLYLRRVTQCFNFCIRKTWDQKDVKTMVTNLKKMQLLFRIGIYWMFLGCRNSSSSQGNNARVLFVHGDLHSKTCRSSQLCNSNFFRLNAFAFNFILSTCPMLILFTTLQAGYVQILLATSALHSGKLHSCS